MKKRMSLQDKAYAALKKVVREVVERHKKTGRPLAVWKNGKTIRISATAVK
jgi:NCAIR mutase (PurE)-related protein